MSVHGAGRGQQGWCVGGKLLGWRPSQSHGCHPSALAPHPHPFPPSLPVTRTKKLVTSIWHLATLTRLQGPMVVSLPLLSSAPLPPPLWFPAGRGPPTAAARPGGRCVRPSACQHTLSGGAPRKRAGWRGRGGEASFCRPCYRSPGPRHRDIYGCLRPVPEGHRLVPAVAAEDTLGGGG